MPSAHGRSLDASRLPRDYSLYEVARAWFRNDAHAQTPPHFPTALVHERPLMPLQADTPDALLSSLVKPASLGLATAIPTSSHQAKGASGEKPSLCVKSWHATSSRADGTSQGTSHNSTSSNRQGSMTEQIPLECDLKIIVEEEITPSQAKTRNAPVVTRSEPSPSTELQGGGKTTRALCTKKMDDSTREGDAEIGVQLDAQSGAMKDIREASPIEPSNSGKRQRRATLKASGQDWPDSLSSKEQKFSPAASRRQGVHSRSPTPCVKEEHRENITLTAKLLGEHVEKARRVRAFSRAQFIYQLRPYRGRLSEILTSEAIEGELGSCVRGEVSAEQGKKRPRHSVK